MSEAVIYASERTEKVNKVRKEGFVPGVINGKGIDSKSIKLEKSEVIKLIHEHANNAKINVKVGDKIRSCVVKEIQKEPTKGKIIHIDLQAIHDEDIIRLKVPVIFTGKEKLGIKHEILQENISEIEIMGKATDIPQAITINIGDREYGDKITAKDIQLEDGLRVVNNENEIIAVITASKEKVDESEEATEEDSSKAD